MATAEFDIHHNLVRRCQRGEQAAFKELYQLYSKAMFNISMRMMHTQQAAEDVLQDAFVDAFKKIGSFRFDSSIGAWIKRIVVNHCINELKKKKADIDLTDSYDAYESRNSTSVDQEEEPQYSVGQVKQAMQELPDGCRLIFSLYMLEGYDHGEIAEIMNVSESTSKSQLLRAKRLIKEYIINNTNSHGRKIR